MNLEEENKILKQKLQQAKKWMQHEVASQKNDIQFSQKIEEKIRYFFSPTFMNQEEQFIQYILGAEILFHTSLHNTDDGFPILVGYFKALDLCIEENISKSFRKFFASEKYIEPVLKDHLEKHLHLVCNKHYILSVGKLYELVKLIQKKEQNKNGYQKIFSDFLKKYTYISDVLLSQKYLEKLEILIKKEIIGRKRHSENIGKEDTQIAQEILVGNLENKNNLLSQTVSIAQVP